MTKPNKPYDTTPRLNPSIQGLYPSSQVYLTVYISLNSQQIWVKFWILNLMTKPNKPYDTTPRLDPNIQGIYPSSQVYLNTYISLNSLLIQVKFWILNLMTKPNKLNDTTPPVMLVKIRLRLSGLYPRFARFFVVFPDVSSL